MSKKTDKVLDNLCILQSRTAVAARLMLLGYSSEQALTISGLPDLEELSKEQQVAAMEPTISGLQSIV